MLGRYRSDDLGTTRVNTAGTAAGTFIGVNYGNVALVSDPRRPTTFVPIGQR